jgi:hypothetical protein
MIKEAINLIDLPDGIYRGYWSDYNVCIPSTERNYNLRMDMDIKGINIPVRVAIKDKISTIIL